MKKLVAQRYTVRRNLVAVVCACLSVYFMWHALLGERSMVREMTLNAKVERLEREVIVLAERKAEMQDKVVRLRPGSLDPDMLEERARLVLGFHYPSERIIIVNR